MPTEPKSSPIGTGITPEFPTEPPQNVKDMTFSFDPALDSNPGVSTITIGKTEVKEEPALIKQDNVEAGKKEEVVVKPTNEVVVKQDTKAEVKKEEKKTSIEGILKPPTEEASKAKSKETKVEEKKEIVKPITPVKDTKKDESDTFDYTKYSPQETINLKNMSRQSREYVAKLIDDNKSLVGLKDSTYLQHEQGYTLSPDYQQLQAKDYYARTEAKCWEQALLNIKAGKKFRDITGFDTKTGQPILSEEREVSDRDEIRISNNLQACIQASNGISGQLQIFPQQFKQRMSTDLQAIQQEQQNRFAWVQDPKLLEYSINIEGFGDKKIKDIRNDVKSLFPPYLSNSVGVDVAANLMVALHIQGAQLREAQNGQQVAVIKQQEVARGEPTSDAQEIEKKPNDKGIPTTFSLEGIPGR